MVDNENQWEDIEYSDETEENQSYSYDDDTAEYEEQSEDQDYSEYDNYEEDEDGEEVPEQKKSNPLVMIIIFLLLLGVIGFIAVPKFMGGAQTASNNTENQSVEMAPASDDLSNSFFEESNGENPDMSSVSFGDNGEMNMSEGNGDNETVATVTDTAQQSPSMNDDLFESNLATDNSSGQENNAIMVVYNKAARTNPFKPPVASKVEADPYEMVDNTQFEIIEPPVASVPDENLTKLLQTQISGILYDNESPSAIVNLNGMDQFVKVGDVISGYKIVSITRDKVQISYKNNSYVASVGELFTKGNLEKRPAVANLENKFAGRYKN